MCLLPSQFCLQCNSLLYPFFLGLCTPSLSTHAHACAFREWSAAIIHAPIQCTAANEIQALTTVRSVAPQAAFGQWHGSTRPCHNMLCAVLYRGGASHTPSWALCAVPPQLGRSQLAAWSSACCCSSCSSPPTCPPRSCATPGLQACPCPSAPYSSPLLTPAQASASPAPPPLAWALQATGTWKQCRRSCQVPSSEMYCSRISARPSRHTASTILLRVPKGPHCVSTGCVLQ